MNGERALEHRGIVANPNCCSIPLALVLAPLRDAAGLRRVRVATYQSASGAGAQALERLRNEPPERARPAHGLDIRRCRVRRGDEDPGGDAQDPRAPRSPAERDVRPRARSRRACGSRLDRDRGRPRCRGRGTDPRQRRQGSGSSRSDTGEGRRDATTSSSAGCGRTRAQENGLALFVACDNLRKGAALNAMQIAELVLGSRATASVNAG